MGERLAVEWADAHEAYGQKPDLNNYFYRDHLTDLVNNEFGRSIGKQAIQMRDGASEEKVQAFILQQVRDYIASGNYARRDDFLPDHQ
ncbi:hypothetical protein GCM10010195_72410 [Kitasatospora griseola]|nr:hypothetical protein [Kitasatospora griseola]GGR06880.1 hypothetical protein GCM10010195_72410 [Kitasatospora griseola]